MVPSLVTAMVGAVVAMVVTFRDRQGTALAPGWWFVGPMVALAPVTLILVVPDLFEVDPLLRYALWGAAFVGTLAMLFATYGRAGDGRTVRLVAPLIALAGIGAVGALNAQLGALIAPLTVFAVVARALPRARSTLVRRRTVAGLGVGAAAAGAAAYGLATATPVFGVAVVVMSVVIAVSLALDLD